jgi:hypothetical protein
MTSGGGGNLSAGESGIRVEGRSTKMEHVPLATGGKVRTLFLTRWMMAPAEMGSLGTSKALNESSDARNRDRGS